MRVENNYISIQNQDKNKLIAAIKEIIEQHTIKTQKEIVSNLTLRGYRVNQSLVSRILKNLGVIKSHTQDGYVYHLPWELSPPNPAPSIKSLIIKITKNEVLIAVQTSPGAASLVARIIDFEKEHLAILATIAGDDTVFVSPKSINDIDKVCIDLESWLCI